jgi:biotin carboxyl carrier protein
VDLQPSGGEPLAAEVEWESESGTFSVRLPDATVSGSAEVSAGEGLLRVDGRQIRFFTARVGRELHLWLEGQVYRFEPPVPGAGARAAEALPASGEIRAPMPGVVVQLQAVAGAEVAAQEPLAVIESMKVQYTLAAPVAGRVAEVCCRVGEMVDLGAVLARRETEPAA